MNIKSDVIFEYLGATRARNPIFLNGKRVIKGIPFRRMYKVLKGQDIVGAALEKMRCLGGAGDLRRMQPSPVQIVSQNQLDRLQRFLRSGKNPKNLLVLRPSRRVLEETEPVQKFTRNSGAKPDEAAVLREAPAAGVDGD